MRRILLFITDLEIGGTPTVVRELAKRLHAPPEVEIEVACLKGWGPVADQIRSSGIAVTAFDMRRVWHLPRAVKRLRRLVRERGIDTVFSFLVHANVVAAMASRKLPGVRFLQSIQTTQSRPAWHWSLQRRVARRAEKIIVPSKSILLLASALGVPEDKIHVVSNAIDPADFDRGRADTHLTEIGFIGRLDPVKRVVDLVQAMAILPEEYRLHVFGEGADRGNIEQEIGRLGLNERVILHSAISRPQEALEKIALLVLPSLGEGFGLVLIEAMAAGVPVVATNAMGINDVVTDGVTGLLVPLRSPKALAEAILRLRDDLSLRERLVAAGLEEVRRRFTWDVVLPRYRSLLSLPSQAGEDARTTKMKD